MPVCFRLNRIDRDLGLVSFGFEHCVVRTDEFWLPGERERKEQLQAVESRKMVQMTEFRVVMPVSVEEYRIAQMYMVTRMQEQQTSSSEGVEVLVNEPFENEEFGKGQYTSKVYHLQSKAPAWVTAIAPANSLAIEEEAWNAYPKCKTILKCPYFNRFQITIETLHIADNGQSTNVHNLSTSMLENRRVEMLDIASNVQDYWSFVIGGDVVDLTTFRSEKTGRGLLLAGWQATCNPVMTAYKLVTVDAPYWGFGYRLEQLVLGGERALFAESHKRCFVWIDEWFGLTFDDVRKLELQMDKTLRMTMHGSGQEEEDSFELDGNGNGSTALTETGESNVRENSPMGDTDPQVDLQKNYSHRRLGSDNRVDGNVSNTMAVTI